MKENHAWDLSEVPSKGQTVLISNLLSLASWNVILVAVLMDYMTRATVKCQSAGTEEADRSLKALWNRIGVLDQDKSSMNCQMGEECIPILQEHYSFELC